MLKTFSKNIHAAIIDAGRAQALGLVLGGWLILPPTLQAALVPLADSELAAVSGQAIGINLHDVAVISDIANATSNAVGSKDTTTTELEFTLEGNEKLKISNFYMLGGGKAGDPTAQNLANRTRLQAGNGIHSGSVKQPILLDIKTVNNTLLPHGYGTDRGKRTALILCWTGADCSGFPQVKAYDSVADIRGIDSEAMDLGLRAHITAPAAGGSDAIKQSLWVEAKNVRFEGRSIPKEANKTFLRPVHSSCNEQPNCTPGNDNHLGTAYQYQLEPKNQFAGSYLALWADEKYGPSFAANLRLNIEQLNISSSTLAAGSGGYDRGDFGDASDTKGIQMRNVRIDLQLGHPFYQPVIIKPAFSYSKDRGTANDKGRAMIETSIEITRVPLNPNYNAGAAITPTNDPCGAACKQFYAANTNLSDIYIGNLKINNQDLGESYIQGLQIQYLKVTTHDVIPRPTRIINQ